MSQDSLSGWNSDDNYEDDWINETKTTIISVQAKDAQDDAGAPPPKKNKSHPNSSTKEKPVIERVYIRPIREEELVDAKTKKHAAVATPKASRKFPEAQVAVTESSDIKEEVNEFTTFGRYIGMQLQKMPLELALQLQADIQTLVTNARLEHIRTNTEA